MHVAITKKAFLNGLVYRFPPSSSAEGSLDETHRAILRLIEKLAIGLGRRSKHAADFGNIKCMHALLKGQHFAFPGHIPSEEVEALLSGESTPNVRPAPPPNRCLLCNDANGPPARHSRSGSAQTLSGKSASFRRHGWRTSSSGQRQAPCARPTS